MSAERRQFFRIKANPTPCNVTIDGVEVEATIVDESSTGMQIDGLRLLSLSLDQKVVVNYRDEVLVGRCRSVTRSEDGLFRVGLFRENDNYEAQHETFLLNTFMNCGEFSIACAIVGTNGDQVHVQLPDGKTFALAPDRVVELTREERYEQLAPEDQVERVQEISAIYNSMNCDIEATDQVEEVLVQEFGPVTQGLFVS